MEDFKEACGHSRVQKKEKPQNIPVRITGNMTEIRTWHLRVSKSVAVTPICLLSFG
jgi:hypothetical protein